MPPISPDPISLTTAHLHMAFRETDSVLSSGTGFIYRKHDANYLITNWHNVSGRHPTTGECLSPTLAVPDVIVTYFRCKDNPAQCLRENLVLYNDLDMQHPVWYEHPFHGNKVDVVAIPLSSELEDRFKFYPISSVKFDSQFKLKVSDDAFVIGYPFSDSLCLELPIWKRASIASEPDVDIGQLPKILIDTATRSGLSGSPVVMQRTGLHGASGGKMTGAEIIGTIRDFIGVYSGRIGADELKAQLGIVWRAAVIDEIIDAGVLGSTPHG